MSALRSLLLGVSIGAVWLVRAGALTLILAPLVVVLLVSINPTGITPSLTSGFTLQWFGKALSVPELQAGLLASLKIALIATPLSLVIGTSAAYAQWRFQPIPPAVAQALFSLPILVPLVVTGLALLNSFSRVGLYSGFWSIALAHVLLAFPFTVRFVLNSLARYDTRLDEAAQSLGAPPHRVFTQVTLPLLRPALFASALFSFVVSFDDFGVAIFLIDAKTVTLPVAMYQYFEWNVDPTLAALSAMLVGFAFLAALACEKTIGLERFVGVQH
jgi:putative spermidine/putrescine transport system permease protein